MDFNGEAYTEGVKMALAQGHAVLNPFMYAPDEQGHCDILLAAMDPPPGALVLDAGCGLGAVAAYMHARRPDLRFGMLNANEFQLQLCPQGDGFTLLHGDFAAMPVADAEVDVVMFNAAFCHATEPERVLAESARVLKDGGRLHISDFARREGDNALLEQHLASYAWRHQDLVAWAQRAGFVLDKMVIPEGSTAHLREFFANDPDYADLFDRMFSDLYPVIYEFKRMPRVEHALERHDRIALEVSGGKDSLACLELLRPYWDRLTVYWLNTGSAFPETVETMARVRQEVPHFVEIAGDQPGSIALHGIPSDIVPTSATPIGVMAGSGAPAIQDRYDCCARVLMKPLHDRVMQDRPTLIIRGQKMADANTAPIRSGHVEAGVEYLFPIAAWTDAEVLAFLAERGVPIPRYYTMLKAAPDCMDCSAWWEEGRAAYLKQHHPEAYARYQARLDTINRAVYQHIQFFNKEVE